MQSTRSPLLVLGILLGSSLALPAQPNLVTNGDFETGNTNGWTFGGYTVGAKVDPFDTTGIGATLCFNNRPGGQTTPAPYPPNWMEQPVLTLPGVEYMFTCDLANARPGGTTSNADGGTVEVLLDGVLVARHAFGAYTLGTTRRERLCARFRPTTSGSKMLRITFHRKYLTSTGANPTPTVYIDNIVLFFNPSLPVLCPRGERKEGGNLDLEVNGAPNARFALFVAAAKLGGGVAVPGFSGLWWLGMPMLVVENGAQFDAAGLRRLAYPIPTGLGLAGLPLHWQAIQVDGGAVSIGEPATFGFYK